MANINVKDVPKGTVMLPYKIVNKSTTINDELVWHRNRFINAFLKIKRFFFKSDSFKRWESLSKINVDASKYGRCECNENACK